MEIISHRGFWLTPEEWLRQDGDPAYAAHNCQIMHYTRRDPAGGDLDPRIRWVRSVGPWDPELSWGGGRWTEIHQRLYTDAELMAIVDTYPPLLDEA